MRKLFLFSFLAAACPSLTLAASFQNGQAARAMIGQSQFTAAIPGANQNLLGGVSGIAYANGRLYAADSNRLAASPLNNRVLVFDTTQIPLPGDDPTTRPSPSSVCGLCGYNAIGVIGQQDYTSITPGRQPVPTVVSGTYQGSLNHATAVGTDGNVVAIADTDNNRVLIWNTPPTSPATPPNVVLGQTNFTALGPVSVTNASTLLAPQGVWIQSGHLLVADSLHHRVLIWNTIPTQNNQPASVVVGQSDFGSAIAPPVTTGNPPARADRLYNPVSVTFDGQHMFVADLGFHRIAIWNSLPTTNGQPADVVVGQPDKTTGVPNFVTPLCSAGQVRCAKTLDTPRFALSDGTRLFVADGGNDRVLIFNSIPTTDGAAADAVLGQPDFVNDIVTNVGNTFATTAVDNTAAVDTLPAPTSLAWDGNNLYVSDPFNRRIEVFSPGDVGLPIDSAVNWASEIIRQEGVVVVGVTTISANDTVTVTIQGTAYNYTVKSTDTAVSIAQGLVSAINANSGDPNVTAILNPGTSTIYLSSKGTNLAFDAISLAASASNTANLTLTTSGSYLSAGTAATAAPGMLLEINAPAGTQLAYQSAGISEPATSQLPTTLGGVQVFMDGLPQPMVKVTPNQIVTLVPWSFSDRNSTSIVVRSLRSDGTTQITTPTSAYVAPANPGLFSDKSQPGPPYPAAQALHQAGNPQAVVSVDGAIKAGDTATITIAGSRNYSYTVQAADNTLVVASALVNAIRADPDVSADLGPAFSRVVITARKPPFQGGSGIGVTTSTSANASITLTAYNAATCCDVTPGSYVTVNNPAQVNEIITVSAAGLGNITGTQPTAGIPFNGAFNNATQSVSATLSGTTAQVIAARVPANSYGKYAVDLLIPSAQPASNNSQLYIAQNAFVSNIVTIPVGVPNGIQDPLPPTTPVPLVCTYSLSAQAKNYLADANTGTVGVNTLNNCSWTATVDQSWITISNGNSGTGSGSVLYSVAANTTGSARSANITVTGGGNTYQVPVTQSGSSTTGATALRFVPLATPCRAADTRTSTGPLGSNSSRDFAIASACGIPAGAQAFALNVTVVPSGALNYLTVWPTGTSRPLVSTLNSDGRIKANSAIMPAGSNGSVSAFATDPTQVILDVTGYFVDASTSGALPYYPIAPCRVMDTRVANGTLGSPSISANTPRAIPILSSACGLPSTAQAYSLNVTALPKASLLYATVWPAGQSQPATSTLNAPTGATTANAAIIPAGTSGALQVFSTADMDLVVDVNGYFAAPTTGGLNYYAATPCRAFDSRFEGPQAPRSGTSSVSLLASGCSVPSSAQIFAVNATVVPTPTLSYLTLWANGQPQPLVSTLNAYDGAVSSNLALVPAASGSINAFATEPTYVIFDLLGYFAP